MSKKHHDEPKNEHKSNAATEAATENGREEPNAHDELEGYRRMIDCAMAGGDKAAA